MFSFIVVVSLVIILSNVCIFWFYTRKKKHDESDLSTVGVLLLLLAVFLLITSLFAPFILTKLNTLFGIDFTQTGQIGDTVGGLMSPFINMSAVIVTALAFYMQYKANKLQIRLFKQQLEETQNQFKSAQEKQEKKSSKELFEKQFYEMLRLHKENVNEIEIKILRHTTNKDVNSSGNTYTHHSITKRNVFVEIQKELEFMIENFKTFNSSELDLTSFQYIYKIYLFGLPSEKSTSKNLEKFNNILYNLQHNQYSESISHFLPFDIPAFKGHSNFLGHYHRHLLHIVKFVANYNPKILDEVDKTNYLKLLRAQLSHSEQALIFYDWLAQHGKAWEDKNNNFFTKYKMIHNLSYRELPQKTIIKESLKTLVNKYKSLGYDDNLFEIGDSDI